MQSAEKIAVLLKTIAPSVLPRLIPTISERFGVDFGKFIPPDTNIEDQIRWLLTDDEEQITEAEEKAISSYATHKSKLTDREFRQMAESVFGDKKFIRLTARFIMAM